MGTAAKAIGAAFVASIGVDTVRAWADATKGALDFAGSLGETAQQVGATTDELQEFRYVASQVGIEQTVMDKGLAKLSVTLGNMAADVGSTAKTLAEFGFSQAEVARISAMSAGEALPFLAEKYAALESPTEKAALAAAFFGSRMGGQFIPLLNEGAAGLDKMRKAAHDLGIVISESAIQNADKNADLIATYEQMAAAQKNAALTVPENVRAYVAYEKTITDVQLGFYKAIASITEFNEWSKTVDQDLRTFGKNTGIQSFFKSLGSALSQANTDISAWAKRTHDNIAAVPGWIASMVTSIQNWIGGAMRRVWDGAIAKLGELGAKFAWLYDVVVGHSYIPDMVDEIGAHMARLDGLMVGQAGKATTATAKKFQELRDLLDDLFPEIGKANTFNADMARIDGSGLSAAAKDEAVQRLWRQTVSGSPFGSGGMGRPDFGSDGGPLVQGIDATSDAIERLTEKSKVNTVRIAKSFSDMADQTLQSLGRLTSAIKNGGFLGILEGVIGLGLQLGSIGAFGKTIAGRLNAVPAHANGTNFAPGGLSLVGERGPELVNLPRGSRVTPNNKLGGGGNTYHIQGNLLTPEFWAQIQAGDIQAAQAGAMGGVARMNHRQSRRWR